MLSEETIQQATGMSWDEWLHFFDAIDAQHLSHQEIVERADELGTPAWWRQMITVAYEQHIGRRVAGQDLSGTFNVSASKTVPGSLDEALARWIELIGDCEEFTSVPISKGPEVRSTEKWRYWRCTLADGSRVVVNISTKPAGRSVISVQHEKLESTEQAEHWRTYWKALLRDL
jgi:hypothetical protein